MSMFKKVAEYLFYGYWVISNMIGIKSFCGFANIKDNTDVVFMSVLVIIVILGTIFIYKFFQKELYKNIASILFYLIIIFYPLILIGAMSFALCGTSSPF